MTWSGARDLNPGPHGPESRDSSSIHVGFLRFSVRFFKSTGPERPDLHESSAGLLHEVLQNAGRPDGFQRDQALRSPWDRPVPATRRLRPWERVPFPEAALSSWVIR